MNVAPAAVVRQPALRGAEFDAVRAAMTPSSRVGRIVVVNGSLGSGKSTLLRSATAHRADVKSMVLRATGVRGESELKFWGLHQLVLPFLSRSPVLARLLEGIMPNAVVSPQSRMDASLLTLQLINRLSADRGTLIVIDDAQFIDAPSLDVIAFLAARLDYVSVILTTDSGVPRQLSNSRARELELAPLSRKQASDYLRARHPELPGHLRQRVITESDGNLRALNEYARLMASDRFESRISFPLFQRMPPRLLETFAVSLRQLPADVRHELLLGAIDVGPRGNDDPGLTRWQASAEHLELVSSRHLAVLSGAGMVFTSSLVRAAVFSLASPQELAAAHAQLAAAYADDPSHSVFHREASSPDGAEQLARELEETGRTLFENGVTGLSLAAIVTAARISPDRNLSGSRLVAAADLAESAGFGTAARRLCEEAKTLGADEHERALVLARVLINNDGDYVAARRLLVETIAAQGELGVQASERSLQLTLQAAWESSSPEEWAEISAALAPHRAHASTALKLFADALVPGARIPAGGLRTQFRIALGELRAESSVEQIVLLGRVALTLDCLSELRFVLREAREKARTSSEAVLNLELCLLLATEAFQGGRWAESARIAEDAASEAQAIGLEALAYRLHHIEGLVAAHQGDLVRSRALSEQIHSWAFTSNAPLPFLRSAEVRMATALAHGDYDDAWSHARQLIRHGTMASCISFTSRRLLDIVETAVRSNHADVARLLISLARSTIDHHGSARTDFVFLAAEALASDQSEAVSAYYEAALATPEIRYWPFEQARVHLLYGQRLRRHFETAASREHLVAAHELFVALKAGPWVLRAEGELRAAGIGQSPPTREKGRENRQVLTPQEHEIAALAARGLSNKEIASQLFLSPRTVSGHLYRIFPKLGVGTRRGLRDAMVPESIRRA